MLICFSWRLQVSQKLHELQNTGSTEGLAEEGRSPSPEPQYGDDGVRINTRPQRQKQKLTAQAQVMLEFCPAKEALSQVLAHHASNMY